MNTQEFSEKSCEASIKSAKIDPLIHEISSRWMTSPLFKVMTRSASDIFFTDPVKVWYSPPDFRSSGMKYTISTSGLLFKLFIRKPSRLFSSACSGSLSSRWSAVRRPVSKICPHSRSRRKTEKTAQPGHELTFDEGCSTRGEADWWCRHIYSCLIPSNLIAAVLWGLKSSSELPAAGWRFLRGRIYPH